MAINGSQTIRYSVLDVLPLPLTSSLRQVLAAQTRLAQDLRRRPELYEMYLTELLTLFCDKGVAIQNAVVANDGVKVGPAFVLHIRCSR